LQGFEGRVVFRLGRSKRPRDCGNDEGRVGERGELNEEDPVREAMCRKQRRLKGQAGISDPARPRESKQPHVTLCKQAIYLLKISLAA